MKAMPILFSGDMVRALLDGRKTQTRRAMKLQPGQVTAAGRPLFFEHGDNGRRVDPKCPYGQVGDLLWVRETHHLSHADAVTYRADFDLNPFADDECGDDCSMVGEKWRSSIHMPRRASRLTLRITNVRVERLQDIREADAIAEGLVSRRHVWRDCEYPLPNVGYLSRDVPEEIHSCPIQAFGDLWQSINGPDSWDANPWVWVLEL